MIDNATAVQMSHCWTSRWVVLRKASNGPKTVARNSVAIDTPVAMLKVLSEKVSRLNTVLRSSLVAIEKNRAYSENVTTPMVWAIGLGYGEPATGLMKRKPRQPDRPILDRGLMIWLIVIGLIMGTGTLGVISWAEQTRTETVAHTMGVVTFSLYAVFFSIATKDERRSVFSLDTFADKTFNISTGVSVLTLILATVLGPFQRLLEMTPLDVQQWLICVCVALSIIVISEIRKALARREGP